MGNNSKVSGIYCIENIIDNKKYIGQGIDVEKRMMRDHRECNVLYNALKFYGENNFIRYVIEYCDEEKLLEKEIYYIDALYSHVSEWGYNVLRGDEITKSFRHTDETKRKISESEKGKIVPNETRQRISESSIGKIISIEGRMNMSFSRIGEKHWRFGEKSIDRTSNYWGVYKFVSRGKYIYWKVEIRENGKRKYLGEYKNEIDAALTYDKYIYENNLPHPLNFPERIINGVYND
jgi:group I intron endonuclease